MHSPADELFSFRTETEFPASLKSDAFQGERKKLKQKRNDIEKKHYKKLAMQTAG
jgi:hypothetical protein